MARCVLICSVQNRRLSRDHAVFLRKQRFRTSIVIFPASGDIPKRAAKHEGLDFQLHSTINDVHRALDGPCRILKCLLPSFFNHVNRVRVKPPRDHVPSAGAIKLCTRSYEQLEQDEERIPAYFVNMCPLVTVLYFFLDTS
jgi:hypothetical protein